MERVTTGTPLRNEDSFAIAWDRNPPCVYGESAFRYFLEIECARSIRSTHPCALLRVDLKDGCGVSSRMSRPTSERLFKALVKSVRETDFVGWYEDQRIAGVVLTEVAGERLNESIRRAVDRIRHRFETYFPVAVSSRLDIRVNTIRDERTWG
jgi:hypothetical protein